MSHPLDLGVSQPFALTDDQVQHFQAIAQQHMNDSVEEIAPGGVAAMFVSPTLQKSQFGSPSGPIRELNDFLYQNSIVQTESQMETCELISSEFIKTAKAGQLRPENPFNYPTKESESDLASFAVERQQNVDFDWSLKALPSAIQLPPSEKK